MLKENENNKTENKEENQDNEKSNENSQKKDLKPEEKISELEGLVIDVRTPEEFSSGHINEATNIDFYANDFDQKLNIIRKDIPIYIYCRSGGRSAAAAKKMEKLGFKKVYNLVGGIGSWTSAGYKIKKFLDSDKTHKEGETEQEPIFTDLEIDKVLINNKIVLLVFSTKWCVPCRKMKPILDDIQKERPNIKVVFIDADVNKELINTYNVNGIPTLIVLKNTSIVYRHVGMISKQQILYEVDYL